MSFLSQSHPRNGAPSAGTTHVRRPSHSLPLQGTSATAGATAALYERARLTPSALKSIIGYLPCNATAVIGSSASIYRNGGAVVSVSGAAYAEAAGPPLIMADALFAAAAQASSTSAATAASTGAPLTPPVPVTVTRPLALLAASPETRRGLEMHLAGGCALPPLGSLVLQVQPHRLPPATATRPLRVGARHASGRRSAALAQVGSAYLHDEMALAASLSALIVSSTNVAITELPFQPTRLHSSSPVTQLPTAQMPLTPSTPLPPAMTATLGDDVGTSRNFSIVPQPPPPLPSRSAFLQSRRLLVTPATPPPDWSPFSSVPVEPTRTSPVSVPRRLLNTPPPPSTAQEVFGAVAARNGGQASSESGARGSPTEYTCVPASVSPALRPALATPPSWAPPPSSTSTAVQTLCHALWWVRRGPLPVSLSLWRYKQAEMQVVLAMLSEAPPQEAAGRVMEEGSEKPPSPPPAPMHVRRGQMAHTPGEPRESCRSTPVRGGDDVRGCRAPVGGPDGRLVAASAGGVTDTTREFVITEVVAATTSSSGHSRPARHSPHFKVAPTQPVSPPGLTTGAGASPNDHDDSDTLGHQLGRPADTVLPSSCVPAAAAVPMLRSPVMQLHVHGKAADVAVTGLLPAHPEVRSLRLTHGTLSDVQLRHLARACPDVTHLSLAMNSRIQTTAFLCPPPSDISSRSPSVTTTTTATTSRTAIMDSPKQDSPHQPTLLHEGGAHHTAATTTHLTTPVLPPLPSRPARSRHASNDDASHAWRRILLQGEEASGDTAGALGPRSEGSRGTDASLVPSPLYPPHCVCVSYRSSQLDLFAPDEEGEPEMQRTLWQAAQTDAEERRQPVFVLRPQDAVLGRYSTVAVEHGHRPRLSTTGGDRDAAVSATGAASSRTLQGSAIEQWTVSHRRFVRRTEAAAIGGTSESSALGHAARRVASGASLLTTSTAASSADVYDTIPSMFPLPSVAHSPMFASTSVWANTDSRHGLRPRWSSVSHTELAVSLWQPSVPTSSSVNTTTSLLTLSVPSPHVVTAAAAAAETESSETSQIMTADGQALSLPDPPAPAVPVYPSSSFSGAATHITTLGVSPHHCPREGCQRCEDHCRPVLRPRPTYWADTLVDLDLSYTQVSDDDTTRDLPQLRCLHRLSLEGCMRLSQVTWAPLLLHLRELNLSLSSLQGHALYPLGRCPRLVWLKLEGCSSFTAIHQLWSREADAADTGDGGNGSGSTAASARVTALATPVVRHTTIDGIPAITVLPPPAGLTMTPTVTATPTAAAALATSFSTGARATTAVGGAEAADIHGEGSPANAADEEIAAEGAEHVPLLSALCVLIATSTGLTDAGLRSLDRMAELNCLMLDRCPGITDVNIVATLPSLHTLDVSRTRVTAEGLAGLRLSRTLKQLRLQDCSALVRLPILLVDPGNHETTATAGGAGDGSAGSRRPAAKTAGALHRPFHGCPPLTVLDLSYTKQLTADGLAGLVGDEAAVIAQAAAAVLAEHLAEREVDHDNMSLASALDEPLPAVSIFPHVRHVLLRSCDAVAELRPLRGFTNVVQLDLYHTSVTEAALTAALASWTSLEVLNIASTRVRSLAAWCPYKPREAVATAAATAGRGEDGDTAEGDGDLEAPLPPLPWHGRLPIFAATLRVLMLSNTDVTSSGLTALKFFPQLEVLQLANCHRLSSLQFLACAAHSAARRSSLSELIVTEAAHLTNAEAFPYIACCPGLRLLSLVGCVQLGSGGNSLPAPGAEYTHLPPPTDDDVSVLGRLRGLTELNLSNSGVCLLDLKTMLCASMPQRLPTATAAQHAHLYEGVSLSLQRLWLRGCRHLDEDALISTAAEALAHNECPCDGSGRYGGCSTTRRLLPLLKEVYLSHGKCGATVLSGLLS